MEVNQELIDGFRAFLLDSPTHNIVEANEFSDDFLRSVLEQAIQEISNEPPQIDLTPYWDQISSLVYKYAWAVLVQRIQILYARNQAIPPNSGIPTIEATRLQLYGQLVSQWLPLIRADLEAFKTAKNADKAYGYAPWPDDSDLF